MMKIKSDIKNKRVFTQIENLSNRSKRGIRQGFYFLGRDLKKDTSDAIKDKRKTGKTYTIYRKGRKRRHQASAPGEAPANLTGNLRKSIGYEVRGGEQLEFGSRASAPSAGAKQNVAKYSVALEEGTTRMRARPYLKPNVEGNYRNAREHFEREICRELTEK